MKRFLKIFAIAFAALGCVASLDFTTSGSRVNHGSGSSIDDLPSAGGVTWWMWVYRTADGANQHLMTKDGSFPGGWAMLVDNNGGEGCLRLIIFRTNSTGSNWTDYQSAAGRIPLNTWTFVAATYDETASPEVVLYYGSRTATVIAETSYITSQNGTGSYLSDAASDLWVCNLQRASTLPLKGSGQCGGLIPSVLTLGQLRTLQFASKPQTNYPGAKLTFHYDGTTGTQPDLSGNGNNGTVTTATRGTPAPLRP